jgi:glycosyltransferase involved in cell wall biosynthesis
MFSGSLIKRKGLDVVLEALSEINKVETKINLDIYGPGEIKEYLEKEIKGVQYKGTYKPGKAQQVMSQYDMLIVPSRHDGWGLVVNEALLQNVPVIVSDRVGAKVLVEYSGAGKVFKSENVSNLTEVLLSIVDSPETLNQMKDNCAKVHDFITPDYGSSYLKKIIDYYFFDKGDRPKVVWKNKSL